ncbi:MAG: glutamate--tRNA ligase [Candidatus Latescibacterota bacterium]|nr:MAG: glutamate--tRNA ligase [Candidatus Latescibacterota bacterium]
MTHTQIRVRFAPSPTGHLHIGGARTALYNWLYARKTGGVFVLRIEDTDAVRSTEESYHAIIDALEWLGLDWDEGPVKDGPFGPYVQSARQVLYHTESQKLLEQGMAYHCFCTPDELEEMRSEALQQRESTRYDGRCRNLPRDEIEYRLAKKVPHVVRFRMPDGETRFNDLIRGLITFQNKELDDFVLVKSDGKPTYNFAAVVDDARMRISHVIRGDDHLSNTPKQVLICKALGYAVPKFAHLPMILGSDRTRLSKRHGASSVQEFRRIGYLSDSLVNYLALLGWAYDDKTEFFTRESLIKKFSLKKVSKNPAAVDPNKLDHIDGEHFKRLDAIKRVSLVYEKLLEEKILPAGFRPEEWAGRGTGNGVTDPTLRPGAADEAAYREELPRLAIILKVMGNRLKNLKDVREKLAYFYRDDYPRDAEASKTYLSSPESAARLTQLADRFEKLEPFDRGEIERTTRELAEEEGIKAADLIHPCRVALTGQSVSPDIFSVVHLLGRKKSVERMRTAALESTAHTGRDVGS